MSLFSFIYYNDYFLFYNCLVISSFLYIYETILNHMQSIHLANRYIFFKKYFIKNSFALIQEISCYRNIKKTHNHVINFHSSIRRIYHIFPLLDVVNYPQSQSDCDNYFFDKFLLSFKRNTHKKTNNLPNKIVSPSLNIIIINFKNFVQNNFCL